jgi:hypothetical protein
MPLYLQNIFLSASEQTVLSDRLVGSLEIKQYKLATLIIFSAQVRYKCKV